MGRIPAAAANNKDANWIHCEGILGFPARFGTRPDRLPFVLLSRLYFGYCGATSRGRRYPTRFGLVPPDGYSGFWGPQPRLGIVHHSHLAAQIGEGFFDLLLGGRRGNCEGQAGRTAVIAGKIHGVFQSTDAIFRGYQLGGAADSILPI